MRIGPGRLSYLGAFGFLLAVLLLTPLWAEGSETYRSAYDTGYVDGMRAGKEDKEQGRPFDFANRAGYQTADSGFDPERHDREVFVVAYRRGFEDGYEVGFGLARRRSPVRSPLPPPVSMIGPAVRDTTETSSGRIPSGRVEVPTGQEFRLRLLDPISTHRNERGDTFRSVVVDDVRVDSTILIPRGAEVHGTVAALKRAGRIAGRAEMGLRFERLRFPDGTTVPIDAVLIAVDERIRESVEQGDGSIEGPSTRSDDLKRIGTTSTIGALIGLLRNGGKGAGVGAAVGGGVGLAGVLATRGREIELAPETELTVRLLREAFVPGP